MKKKCFRGLGIALDAFDTNAAIEELPPPKQVLLPLYQKSGRKLRQLVERGEEVFTGEKIAADPNGHGPAVHASITGRLTDVRPHRFTEFGVVPCMVIESTGSDELRGDLRPIESPWEAEPDRLRDAILEAGVNLPWADMSGASPRSETTLVVNGIQEGLSGGITRCILGQYPKQMADGGRILCRIFGVDKIILAADKGDLDWWEALQEADGDDIFQLRPITPYYPVGHAGLLIAKLLKIETLRPQDEGISVFTVPSILQIVNAIMYGRPAIDAYLTVGGPCIERPSHLIVRIGTSLKTVIDHCGGMDPATNTMVLGTPLNGTAQYTTDRPVLKDAHWLWVTHQTAEKRLPYRPCLNCGDCVDICPMRLMPNALGKLCEFDQFREAATRYASQTCIECGLCSYVCPARRPLVQFISHGNRQLSQEANHHGTQ